MCPIHKLGQGEMLVVSSLTIESCNHQSKEAKILSLDTTKATLDEITYVFLEIN